MSDPQPGAVQVAVSAWSDPGRKRTQNQDNFLVADLSVAEAEGGFVLHGGDGIGLEQSRETTLGRRGLLAVVADGMGGAAGGQVASQLAVAWTYKELRAQWDALSADGGPPQFVRGLRAAIEAANARVHEQGQKSPQYTGMGSTMTAVGILGGAFYIAQVGDSRAYLVRGGRANRLTRDQSLVQQLVDAGAMTPEEALRSPHGSVLLQALGTNPAVQVELTWEEARRGDVLVLCSDGLFRVVADHEIAAAVLAAVDTATLCRGLVDLANERGGPDNITVIAIRVDGDALEAPESDELLALNTYVLPS